jgi:hypothetical protein
MPVAAYQPAGLGHRGDANGGISGGAAARGPLARAADYAAKCIS